MARVDYSSDGATWTPLGDAAERFACALVRAQEVAFTLCLEPRRRYRAAGLPWRLALAPLRARLRPRPERRRPHDRGFAR